MGVGVVHRSLRLMVRTELGGCGRSTMGEVLVRRER